MFGPVKRYELPPLTTTSYRHQTLLQDNKVLVIFGDFCLEYLRVLYDKLPPVTLFHAI
jgi:hypothetical protein